MSPARRVLPRAVAALAMVLGLANGVRGEQKDPSLDAALRKGIALVEEGDYGAAILALEEVVIRLARLEQEKQRVARAHLYLGIAHVGEGQESLATASFREALRHDATLTLNAELFSPKVREHFQRVKNALPAMPLAPATAVAGGIAFVSVEPPHGSTVTLGREGTILRLVAAVTHDRAGRYRLFATDRHEGGTGRECVCGVSDALTIKPGQRVVATIPLQSPCGGSTPGCPRLPFDSTGLSVHMYRDDPGEAIVIPETIFPVTHAFIR